MKNDCAKWKEQLLEAALAETTTTGLAEHVLECPRCAEELVALRERRKRLDTLLPLVANSEEPSAEFRPRVLGAAEARERRPTRPWQVWGLAGAMAVIVATLTIGLALRHKTIESVPESELSAAQKLAEWRAPTDGLLETPGRQILRTTPKLGESYLPLSPKTDEEK
jgi:anti-sigma factor RsiW